MGPDLKVSFLILLNLILIETLLSIDTAFIFGVLINRFEKEKRTKVRRIALIIFFVLRALFLVFVSLLIKILFLKVLIGLYFSYVAIRYFLNGDSNKPSALWLLLMCTLFELMGMLEYDFSQNFSPIVAFTDNIYLIMLGILISFLVLYYILLLVEFFIEKFRSVKIVGYVALFIIGIRPVIEIIMRRNEIEIIEARDKYLCVSERIDLFFSFGVAFLLVCCILYDVIRKRSARIS